MRNYHGIDLFCESSNATRMKVPKTSTLADLYEFMQLNLVSSTRFIEMLAFIYFLGSTNTTLSFMGFLLSIRGVQWSG